eukprot:1990220-Alexandrium_andersonii.AAC.1
MHTSAVVHSTLQRPWGAREAQHSSMLAERQRSAAPSVLQRCSSVRASASEALHSYCRTLITCPQPPVWEGEYLLGVTGRQSTALI